MNDSIILPIKYTDLEKHLGKSWLKNGDKKNFTYDLIVDINVYYEELEEYIYFESEDLISTRIFNTFLDMALNLLCLEIDKVYSFEIDCE